MPIGAISGIDGGNAADVGKAGADGIAVISALFDAPDVTAAARTLLAATKAGIEARRGGGR
jgi:thiamine-phosphate pyrophosphorylase